MAPTASEDLKQAIDAQNAAKLTKKEQQTAKSHAAATSNNRLIYYR